MHESLETYEQNRTRVKCWFSRGATTAALAAISKTKVPVEEGLSAFGKLAIQMLEKELTMCGNESGNGAAVSYINMPASLSATGARRNSHSQPNTAFLHEITLEIHGSH